MGNKKTVPVWRVFLEGALVTLGVYVGGVALLALLVVKGAVPEDSAFPVLAALCALAAVSGGLPAAKRSPWGTLPSALLNTAIFAAVLATVGLLCWEEGVAWNGRGGILLLCALAGGVLAGVLGGRRPARRKKRK